MIHFDDTKQYTVNPREMVASAFDSSYSRYSDTQVAPKPDKSTMVCSVISLVFIIFMFILTSMRYTQEKVLWFVLSIAMLVIIAYIIYKYWKKLQEYRKASGKPSTINAKRLEFYKLFVKEGEGLSAEMNASELQDIIRPHLSRQYDIVANTALRTISEELVTVNNPELPRCKNITQFEERFTQNRNRFYIKSQGGKYIFFDSDWQDPKGQIEFDESDLISYGKYSQYQGVSYQGSGKIRPDSIIIEMSYGEGSAYFEAIDSDYEALKKMFPGRKEKK